MTGFFSTGSKFRATAIGLAGLAMLAASGTAAYAGEHRSDGRQAERHHGDRHDDHRGDRRGRGYYPPPVVYGGPYYAQPPVVYGPSIGIALPGISIGIQ